VRLALPEDYHELAVDLVTYYRVCWGDCGYRIDHKAGRALDGEVHWYERAPQLPGVYRFCLLVALADMEESDASDPEWLRFHDACRQALRWANGYGKVPRDYARRERARLRSMIARATQAERSGTKALSEALIKAQRWAQET